MITVDCRTKEQKKADRINAINQKISEFGEWWANNKAVVLGVGAVVTPVAGFVIKDVARRSRLAKIEQLKDLYCYDRSLGHYWKLKRKLRSDEWLEIERRRRNGERLGDILSMMKVLK